MSDDYLFERKGPPDPEVERLERLLAPHRHSARPLPPLPDRDAPSAAAPALRRLAWKIAAGLLAAAALGYGGLRLLAPRGAPTRFALADAHGDVKIIEGPLATCSPPDAGHAEALRRGARVVCGEDGGARVSVGDLGSVTLQSRTSLRVERCAEDATAEGAYRLYLERGTLEASIFAAPRVFELGTPSGIAVDLGCIYRTTVDDRGHTRLSVVVGKVSFESEGRKVRVPSGATCRAVPGRGPGTPVWDDAPTGYADAVETIDAATSATASLNVRALAAVLKESRPKDSLTLWNLLDHPRADVREPVFDRLAELVPPPAGLERRACEASPRAECEAAPPAPGADAAKFAEWEEAIRATW